jgi:predicted outer membrane repeat protein
MRVQRDCLVLLLLPALALAGCNDRPEPTGPAPVRPAFSHAPGDTCVVTSTADGGAGTLRDAIDNHACGTITFDVTGPIELTSAQLIIGRNVTIAGPGADQLTVRRSAAAALRFRIFLIEQGTTAIISGLTISGGMTPFINPFSGGGILNSGTLTVTHSTIAGNDALVNGGGIDNSGVALTVAHSTISGNTATTGGGIVSSTPMTLLHTTVSGNRAGQGGGIYQIHGSIHVSHSTISGNSASLSGGAIASQTAGAFNATTLRNTIVAANGAENCYSTGDLPVDAGHNLEDGTSCRFSASTSHSSTSPLTGPLADNGGPTWTHALLAGSPAIDTGTCTDHLGNTVATDQRGVRRPQGAGCDIGAFEQQAVYDFRGFIAPVANPNQMNVAKAGQAIPLKWRLLDANGSPVTTLSSATVTVVTLACSAGSSPDAVEEYAAGKSGLQNLGEGY